MNHNYPYHGTERGRCDHGVCNTHNKGMDDGDEMDPMGMGPCGYGVSFVFGFEQK